MRNVTPGTGAHHPARASRPRTTLLASLWSGECNPPHV